MFWILIASTGEQKYLQETLNRLNWLPEYYKKKVVVSIYSSNHCYDFTNAEIIRRKEPFSQFDHYDLLSKELPIADEDRVVLLDDDDILLPNALHEEGSYIGQQILVDNEHVNNICWYVEKSKPIDEININNNKIVDDFSGTTTSGKAFKEYFINRPSFLARMLEDIKYMDYIETLPDLKVRKKPFVLHRLKKEPSLWKIELREVLSTLL